MFQICDLTILYDLNYLNIRPTTPRHLNVSESKSYADLFIRIRFSHLYHPPPNNPSANNDNNNNNSLPASAAAAFA